MDEVHEPNPLNTPKFIREREAWYKAGAHTMAIHAALAVLLVGLTVGVASWFMTIEPYQAATTVVVGTWIFIAAAGFLADISARTKAERGGVRVDRF